MRSRNIFEQVKQIIHEQTRLEKADNVIINNVIENVSMEMGYASGGGVSGGGSGGTGGEGEIPGTITLTSLHSWYVLTATTASEPTYADLLNAYSEQRPGFFEIRAINGAANFKNVTGDNSVLFLTTANVTSGDSFILSVTSANNTIVLYIDGVSTLSGTGTLSYNSGLAVGRRLIGIKIYGTEPATSVSLTSTSACEATEPLPPAPTWSGTPTVTTLNYLEAKAVTVAWLNDKYASAWQVYRAKGVLLGVVSSAVDNLDLTADIVIDEEVTLSVGDILYLEAGRIGTVASSSISSGTTDVEVNITGTIPVVNWPTENIYLIPAFRSVQRVTDSGTATIQYRDVDVTAGELVVYKVTAFGLFTGANESDYSAEAFAFIGGTPTPTYSGAPSLDVTPSAATETHYTASWVADADTMAVSVVGVGVSYIFLAGSATSLTGTIQVMRPDSGDPPVFLVLKATKLSAVATSVIPVVEVSAREAFYIISDSYIYSSSVLSSTGAVAVDGIAAASALATLSGFGNIMWAGAGSISGAASVASLGGLVPSGAASLVIASTVTATGVTNDGEAVLTSNTSLTADGDILGVEPGAAILSVNSTIEAGASTGVFDLGSEAIDQTIPGWWNMSKPWKVEYEAGAFDNRVYTVTPDADGHGWSMWRAKGEISGDQYILARVRAGSNYNQVKQGLLINFSEGVMTGGSWEGYQLWIADNEGMAIWRHGTGGGVIWSVSSFGVKKNGWYWMRLERVGSALRVKVWLDEVAEPGTYYTVTNTVRTSGYVGLYAYKGAVEHACDYFEVATNAPPAVPSLPTKPSYVTDFSEFSVGALPTYNVSTAWGSSANFAIGNDAAVGSGSGKYLTNISTNTQDAAIMFKDAGSYNTGEMLIRFKPTTVNAIGALQRGINTYSTRGARYIYPRNNSTQVRLGAISNATPVTLNDLSYTWEPNHWYYMRVRMPSEGEFYYKVWKVTETEPGSFGGGSVSGQANASDIRGRAGIFALANAGTWYVDYVAIERGTGTAPMPTDGIEFAAASRSVTSTLSAWGNVIWSATGAANAAASIAADSYVEDYKFASTVSAETSLFAVGQIADDSISSMGQTSFGTTEFGG